MSKDRQVKQIAIVGGGTAGWMAASMLARALTGTGRTVTLIESTEIGTIGVGEATIPPIVELLRFLGINEADFVRHTQATYKLGIKFKDWQRVGHSFWHPFGTFGTTINRRPFYHYWQRARQQGVALTFNDYSLCAALGDQNKFLFPDAAADGPAAGLRYALHFDAGLVARYLRAYAEQLGVVRLERTVAGATLRPDGFIDTLQFSDGDQLRADLFVDCSGFRGLLIEETLQTGYLDWTHWLPCDRAVAMPTDYKAARAPYTLSTARPAGWHWRIPLQHRAGNGYVYASAQIDDQAALDDLQSAVGEKPLAEPRFLRFVTGRRRLLWNRNCVALGLASGFLEPLESTSIHLVMSGIFNLLDHFPDLGWDPRNIQAYNDELISEIEQIRDFIILHYCVSERRDSALWRQCRVMALPDSLTAKIELYRGSGRIPIRPGELFTDLSWFYIFDGMGLRPQGYDPLADVVPAGQMREILTALAQATNAAAAGAPPHDSYFPGSKAAE